MDVYVAHPRPWRVVVEGDWVKLASMSGNLVCILGYAQDAYIRAEAACIVAAVNAAVNPLDVASDFISIPKAAWDNLADRAHDPTMAEGLAQSIREVDKIVKGAVSGSEWKP